jgi:sensor histidine kinase YesM
MLRLYLDLARVRYNQKFDFTIEVDERLPRAETGIPPMLLQPFVENAIIHGIAPRDTKGHVNIRFERNGTSMICSVQDDGIGREAAALNNKNKPHQSKAIAITQQRLELLQQQTGSPCELEIEDVRKDGEVSGTLVRIRIPIKQVW